MIQTIGTVLVVISAVAAWATCIAYQASAPWWRSEAGRHLMATTAVLAAVLTLWSIGALTPTATRGSWWEVTRLITFAGVPAVLVWRLVMVIRIQIWPAVRRPRRREMSDAPDDPSA